MSSAHGAVFLGTLYVPSASGTGTLPNKGPVTLY